MEHAAEGLFDHAFVTAWTHGQIAEVFGYLGPNIGEVTPTVCAKFLIEVFLRSLNNVLRMVIWIFLGIF